MKRRLVRFSRTEPPVSSRRAFDRSVSLMAPSHSIVGSAGWPFTPPSSTYGDDARQYSIGRARSRRSWHEEGQRRPSAGKRDGRESAPNRRRGGGAGQP